MYITLQRTDKHMQQGAIMQQYHDWYTKNAAQ